MFKSLAFMLFLTVAVLHSQTLDEQENTQRQRLEALRREIAQAEKQALEIGKSKAELNDLLTNLDQKISLRKRLLKGLEDDRLLIAKDLSLTYEKLKLTKSEIIRLESVIDSTKSAISRFQSMLAKRAVYIYQHKRTNEIALLLSARDFNQFRIRKKYLDLVNHRDLNNITLLKEKKGFLQELKNDKLTLKSNLSEAEKRLKINIETQKRLITEAELEKQKLQSERQKKQGLLEKVKKDHSAILKNIQDKKSAAAQIEKIISELEAQKKAAKKFPPEDKTLDFAGLKGKLDWPAKGKVIAKFGRQLNPELDTWTENPGIDIKAPAGSPVKAVASGYVSVVTWLRGYGTTLIINHPGDYYTVYTHLDEILVSPGSYVNKGSAVATVGDSGSLGTTKLHFELWERKHKLNPEDWLKDLK